MCLVLLLPSSQGSAAAAGLQGVTAKSAALLPEGGASDVGASLCKYAQEQKVREGGVTCADMRSVHRSHPAWIVCSPSIVFV